MNDQGRSLTVRDQIQMALAIADSTLLKSLLTHCLPPIANSAHIGTVTSEVGIPVKDQPSADGILRYEAVRCVLAESSPSAHNSYNRGWPQSDKDLARITQHESEMHTLVQNLSLAPAIALLTNAGFQQDQIQDILRLPHYAWHKSWWYAIDPDGNFTIPFLRCIRTFHYPDGTLTLQYKDFFDQIKPDCFTCLPQKILIVIRSHPQGFAETLQQINRQREGLGIQKAVLVCDGVSELEIQAFTKQTISLYPAENLMLPIQANCAHCGRHECPMNHQLDSPVVMCRGFLTESEFIG
jgi:bacterioferritin-associated ferredoxin